VELIARVRSQLRRFVQLGGKKSENTNLVIGNIELDDKSKTVRVDGEIVSLTPTEFEILKLLMKNKGKVLSPKEIYESIWHEKCLGNEGSIAVHIRHLREKIEINPAEPRYLKVVWAHGYKMEG
jgi:DNA-binding response OmpR family regulator